MEMISADMALELIFRNVKITETVTLSLDRAAGHSLARDVVADGNIPPFDNSAMDGYALRSSDTARGSAVLNLTGEVAAGDYPAGRVRSGETRAVMTGAPIPEGADAVVPIEKTERLPGDTVKIPEAVVPGTHIRRAGTDIRKGDTVLSRGDLLRPFELGVLASLGVAFVEVFRKPATALLSTGSELWPHGSDPPAGKIRESSSHVITSLLRESGCPVTRLGIAADRDDDLRNKLRDGLAYDLLITMGAVSAGKYDSLPRLLEDGGATVFFHRVNIKPGMPLLFALWEKVPVFALPGNPVSAVVTYLEFVRPAIRKMSGEREFRRRSIVRARLDAEVKKSDAKKHFMRGRYTLRNGEWIVAPAGAQDSNLMSVLASSNCLMILPEEGRIFRKSDYIDVELL